MNSTRRNFLKNIALTGCLAGGLPPVNTFAYYATSQGRPRATKGMVFLFQGDSITDGNRGRSNDPNHIMGHGYAFGVASTLGARYPEKQYRFYNRGISGNTIAELQARWKPDTLDLQPDLLSMLIGINDASSCIFGWDQPVTELDYAKLYRDILDRTLCAYPSTLLVLCEPFVLKVGNVASHWEAYREEVSARQTIVRKLAGEFHAIFIGYQKIFDEACRRAAADYWIWDGIHPTVSGHGLMAAEWMKQVGKRLSFR